MGSDVGFVRVADGLHLEFAAFLASIDEPLLDSSGIAFEFGGVRIESGDSDDAVYLSAILLGRKTDLDRGHGTDRFRAGDLGEVRPSLGGVAGIDAGIDVVVLLDAGDAGGTGLVFWGGGDGDDLHLERIGGGFGRVVPEYA